MIDLKRPETIEQQVTQDNIKYRMDMYDEEVCKLVMKKDQPTNHMITVSLKLKERNDFYNKNRAILEEKS